MYSWAPNRNKEYKELSNLNVEDHKRFLKLKG